MEPSDHFAAARDGTRIAWTSVGEGVPTVVLTDGIGCSGFIWRYLEPALAVSHRTLHWNYRGHGRSRPPRDAARATVLDCVDDLFAVLDDAGEEAVVLAGHSMGVQVCIEAHRRAPERVLGLLLVCGAPGRTIDHFHDSPVLRAVFPFVRELVQHFPDTARLLFRTLVPTELALRFAMAFEVNARLVTREDLVRYLEDLSRVEPTLFVRMLGSAAEHDPSDHLPAIRVPTLVVAGENDSFTPMWLSVKMHEAIPRSELLVLPGGTHVGPLEHRELVALRVERWFRDRFPARTSTRRRAGPRRRRTGPRETH